MLTRTLQNYLVFWVIHGSSPDPRSRLCHLPHHVQMTLSRSDQMMETLEASLIFYLIIYLFNLFRRLQGEERAVSSSLSRPRQSTAIILEMVNSPGKLFLEWWWWFPSLPPFPPDNPRHSELWQSVWILEDPWNSVSEMSLCWKMNNAFLFANRVTFLTSQLSCFPRRHLEQCLLVDFKQRQLAWLNPHRLLRKNRLLQWL